SSRAPPRPSGAARSRAPAPPAERPARAPHACRPVHRARRGPNRNGRSPLPLAGLAPPWWGRAVLGGIAEHLTSGFPPPPTPPRVVSKTRLRHDGKRNQSSLRHL